LSPKNSFIKILLLYPEIDGVKSMIVNRYPMLTISWKIVNDVKVTEKRPPIIFGLIQKTRELWKDKDLTKNEVIRSYRKFFWSLKVDPTKIRPSAEALIRRILRGKSLPKINNVVDALNIASVETLITFSVFDLDKVSPPLEIVESKGGETMVDISGNNYVFPPGFPLMKDSKEQIMAAVIFRDAYFSRVTEDTKNILVIGYAPKGISRAYLKSAVNTATNYILDSADGKISEGIR